MPRILFVCMGNICRSPTAEAVFRAKVADAGAAARFDIDSAGTIGYHTGNRADPRMRDHASRRGYNLTSIARQVEAADFDAFDLIVAMDRENLSDLTAQCPEELQSKLRLMMDFVPDMAGTDVPDPYYGGPAGFERVLDLIEQAADGLLSEQLSA